MSSEVATAWINILPSVLWVLLIAGLVIVFYKPLQDEILPRLTGFNVFGFEMVFQEQLGRALDEKVEIGDADRTQLLRRALGRVEMVKQILPGARILWVDDNPANNVYEANVMSSVGISVVQLTTSEEALKKLSEEHYDAIISDMSRGQNDEEGLRFLSSMRNQNLEHPTIFYIGQVDPSQGVPPYAFGITDHPDELLHLLLDVLERRRSNPLFDLTSSDVRERQRR